MITDPTPVVRTLSGSPYRSFEEFFLKNGAEAEVFRINPTRRTTIVGKKGIRLTFFPFSLCDVFGQPTREAVTIKLIEVNSRPEMLRSDKVTISEDRLLESAGQFFVQASQNFLPIELNQSIAVELPFNDHLRNPLAMRLYEGSISTTRSFGSERAFDWKPTGPNKALKIKKLGDKKYFSFELDQFKWFSCNYLLARRAGRTMVSARMVCPVRELDDQAAFLVFRDANAVARMYPAGNKFTIFNVPVNKPVQVLIMGLHRGQLYFGRTNIEKTSSSLVQVDMQAVSEKDLLTAIDEL